MNNKCPKCGKKLSPFYLKQNCPHCGVDLLYYKLDERLEADAAESARQVEKLKHFTDTVKSSSVASYKHIIRLVLFFTPLLSMCLPMYRAAHKNVSLIGFIMSIVNHGFDMGAWSTDYLCAVLAIIFVILLSLAVIISSLFSVTKHGSLRNCVLSLINTAVFGALSMGVCLNGGAVKIGFYLTLAIYAAEFALHFIVSKKHKEITVAALAFCLTFALVCTFCGTRETDDYKALEKSNSIRVVSFNTAAPWGTSFDGTAGDTRAQLFTDYMRALKPSLIGTQELNGAWLERINEALPEYESYAVKRGGDDDENRSEMNGIFWLKDEFTAAEKNTFWLSNTPNEESRFTYIDENGDEQEAGCNRICSYAVLKANSGGKTVIFMNTHLDNSSDAARIYGAKLIISKAEELKAKYTDAEIILTGDFNQTSDSKVYKVLASELHDTTDTALATATWQDWGYTNTGDEPIDFIFTSAEKYGSYEVLNCLDRGYVSDHYGIMAEIDLGK